MSVKKQIQSLSKLYAIYEEVRESFVAETDVDSYLYYNIYGIFQSPHRTVRVSRGSNKNQLATKVFKLCDRIPQQRYFLKRQLLISSNENGVLLDNLRYFPESFEQATKSTQIPLMGPKVEISSIFSKDNLFAHCCKDIREHSISRIRLSFRFQKFFVLSVSFTSKFLTFTETNWLLQRI